MAPAVNPAKVKGIINCVASDNPGVNSKPKQRNVKPVQKPLMPQARSQKSNAHQQ